ncbi:MAG: isoprenylcysteine carboxylmethyltransferase family protein [Gammaproteobacteria bacterium]|jgi:protein-S-isoprenylcysteine O-methyltransferase Ste14|nr:isoprenylcysteine carboxylmethyltransferase family protein [Gammaproteobacteria bacterium]
MMVAIGNFAFRFRNYLFPLALPLVLLPGPRLFEAYGWAALLGLVVALAGQAVRAMTIALKYIIRGGRDRRVYAEDLVTDGLYAHCRNPMYLGNILMISGVAITSNSWCCVLVVVPLFSFLYLAIIAAEQAYLQQKFGAAFRAYCRDVPGLLPRLRGLAGTIGRMEFHWRRLLVKEYGTVFGWVSRWILVVAYNLWLLQRLSLGDGAVQALLAGFLAVLAFWLAVRSLKHRRVVVAD